MASKGDLVFNLGANVEPAARLFNAFYQKDVLGQAQVTAEKVDQAFGAEITKKCVIKYVKNEETGKWEAVAEAQTFGSVVEKINRNLEYLNSLQEGSVTVLRQQVNTAKQQRDIIAKTVLDVDDYGNKIKITNNDWVAANQKVESLNRQLQIASASNFWDRLKAELNLGPIIQAGQVLNDLVNTFQSVSIVIGQILGAIGQVTGALAQLQQLQLGFNSIGVSATEFNTILNTGISISAKYGASFDSIFNGFQRLTPTLKAAGLGTEEVANIVDALSSRFVAFGLSADESNRVMNAVVQAFGKGKLQAEELTQQISEADPAFRVNFAQALGVSNEKLGEMVEQGQITVDVLAATIPKIAVTSDLFGKLGNSASSAADAFAQGQATFDQVRNTIDRINKLSLFNLTESLRGFIDGVVKVQAAVADLFSELSKSSVLKVFGDILGGLLSVLASVVNGVTALVGVINALVSPILNAISALDKWLGSFLPFQPLLTAVTALIGISLTKSVVTFLGSLSDTSAIGKFFGLIVSGAQGTAGLFTGAFDLMKGGITGLVNAFSNLKSLTKQDWSDIASSFMTGAKGAEGSLNGVKTAISKFTVETGSAAAGAKEVQLSLFGTEAANKVASAGFLRTAEAVGALTVSLVALAAKTVIILAIVAAISALVEAFTGLGIATRASEDSAKAIDKINEKFRQVPGATTEASNSAEGFAKKLEELRDKNIETAFTMQSLLGKAKEFAIFQEIGKTIEAASTANGKLNTSFQTATQALAAYSEQAGQTDSALKEQTTQAIQQAISQAEEQIKIFVAARENLITELEKKGTGIDEENQKRLQNLAAFTELWTQIVTKLRNDARDKGIVLSISGDIAPLDGSIAVLKAKIDDLEKQQATIGFTTSGFQEVQDKILAAKTQVEILTRDPYTVQIKIIQEGDLEQIKSAAQLYGYILDYVKARITLEQSSFDLAKSSAEYQISKAKELRDANAEARKTAIDGLKEELTAIQAKNDETMRGLDKELSKLRDTKDEKLGILNDELDALREKGASQDEIKKKEKEIKEYTKKMNDEIKKQEQIIAAEKERALQEEARKKEEIAAAEKADRAAAAADRAAEKAEKERINQIEAAAATAKMAALEQQIQVERAMLELKIQQQQAELEINRIKTLQAGIAAQLAYNEAQANLTAKERNLLEAQRLSSLDQSNTKLAENVRTAEGELQSAREKLRLMADNLQLQDTLNQAYNQQVSNFQAGADLQRQTFELNAQAQRNEAAATAAKYGEIATSAQGSFGEATRAIAGTIEVGGKLVTVYKEVDTTVKQANISTKDTAQSFIQVGTNANSAYNAINQIPTGLDRTKTSMQGIVSTDIGIPVRKASSDLQAFTIEVDKTTGKLKIIPTIDLGSNVRDANGELLTHNTRSAISKEAIEKIAGTNISKPFTDAKTATDDLKNSTSQAKTDLDNIGKIKIDQPAKDAKVSIDNYTTLGVKAAATALAQLNLLDLTKPSKDGKVSMDQYKSSVDIVQSGLNGALGFIEKITGLDISKPFKDSKVHQDTYIADAKASKTSLDAINNTNISTPYANAKAPATELTNATNTTVAKVAELKTATDQVAGAYDRLSNIKLAAPVDSVLTSLALTNTEVGTIITSVSSLKTKLEEVQTVTKLVAESFVKLDIEKMITKPLQQAQTAFDTISKSGSFGAFKTLQTACESIKNSLEKAGENVKSIASSNIDNLFKTANGWASQMVTSTESAMNNVNNIVSSIKSLNGFNATVTVTVVKAAATGGPVSAGQVYQVNEIGREGFLSSTGRFSMINRPPYGLWKAPSDGTVIPASLVSQFKIPSIGIKSNAHNTSKFVYSNNTNRSASHIGRAVYDALIQSGIVSKSNYNANSQAFQAVQIGKLTHAINKLVDKEWGVNVNVKNKSNSNIMRIVNGLS